MFTTQSAAAYTKVGVETGVGNADPHALILMLFDGALLAINSAAIAMAKGEVATKGQNISKAIEIITYGLKASLDAEAGGQLADRLGALYDYMCERLLFANLHNSDAILSEVASLLRDLKDAWENIGSNAAGAEKVEA